MLRRNHLHRTLERLKKHRPEHAEAIQTVLDNEGAMSQLHDKVKAELPPVDTGHPILDWLWNHREEILKFILAIVAMLGAGS